MRKIDWNIVRNVAEGVCEFASCVLLITASHKAVEYATEGYISRAGYNEAVKAIMDSSMYSHDKCDAVATLKRNEDAEFYKAIIHVAKDSRLYSHDKLDLIKGLCED